MEVVLDSHDQLSHAGDDGRTRSGDSRDVEAAAEPLLKVKLEELERVLRAASRIVKQRDFLVISGRALSLASVDRTFHEHCAPPLAAAISTWRSCSPSGCGARHPPRHAARASRRPVPAGRLLGIQASTLKDPGQLRVRRELHAQVTQDPAGALLGRAAAWRRVGPVRWRARPAPTSPGWSPAAWRRPSARALALAVLYATADELQGLRQGFAAGSP